MSDAKIFVGGAGSGANSKEFHTRCREAFHKLLEKSGFADRLPRIIPCGSRNEAYDSFQTAYEQGKTAYVALLVDSEDPVADPNKPWEHLHNRKGCIRLNSLPSTANLETKHRHHDIQDKLIHATQDCSNAYKKKRFFRGACQRRAKCPPCPACL